MHTFAPDKETPFSQLVLRSEAQSGGKGKSVPYSLFDKIKDFQNFRMQNLKLEFTNFIYL